MGVFVDFMADALDGLRGRAEVRMRYEPMIHPAAKLHELGEQEVAVLVVSTVHDRDMSGLRDEHRRQHLGTGTVGETYHASTAEIPVLVCDSHLRRPRLVVWLLQRRLVLDGYRHTCGRRRSGEDSRKLSACDVHFPCFARRISIPPPRTTERSNVLPPIGDHVRFKASNRSTAHGAVTFNVRSLR